MTTPSALVEPAYNSLVIARDTAVDALAHLTTENLGVLDNE